MYKAILAVVLSTVVFFVAAGSAEAAGAQAKSQYATKTMSQVSAMNQEQVNAYVYNAGEVTQLQASTQTKTLAQIKAAIKAQAMSAAKAMSKMGVGSQQ